MLLGWGAQEALRVRVGRLARSSLDVGASGLVRSKESIPAIRFVRVVLLSTISVLYRVCQTNNSTLDCSVGQNAHTSCGPELNPYEGVRSCAKNGTMVLNGRIKTGNVAGERFLPLPSAGRRSKSGYLVDSRKSLVSLSGERESTMMPPRSSRPLP